MIIHFIAAKTDIVREYEYLRSIVRTVRDLGHEFAREWVEEEYNFVTSGKKHASLDWKKINQDNLGALARADLVIAEATTRSFSTGFQVATAIQQKKPVLILARNNSLVGTFGSGINSDFVRIVDYSTGDLKDIISDFINENSVDTKDLRFNFFIDRQIYNYLRWASFKSGKTKAEILRELVQKEIGKEDF